jgi:glycosyltransferase involved in cell wall biosynthesis
MNDDDAAERLVDPDVVVAVPVFNGEKYLDSALRSALAQSVPPRHVVVFDNCSTDGTIDIAREYLPDAGVNVASVNAGAVANFNRAVLETESTYFQWLAADDRLLPQYLEKCLAALSREPDAPAAIGGVRFIDPEGQILREQRFMELDSRGAGPRLRAFLRQKRWTEAYALYRRVELEASPMLAPEYAADVLLTWWFLLRGRLAVVDDIIWEYREYPEKTVVQMAQTLTPSAPGLQWRKVRLWRRLRAETRKEGVTGGVGRIARRELWLAIAHTTWRTHLAEDVLLWLDAHAHHLALLLRRAKGAR